MFSSKQKTSHSTDLLSHLSTTKISVFYVTFETRVAQVLATEALDILDAVDDDGSPQDVSQCEDMQLFQAGAGLRGERHESRPVLLPLRLLQGELQHPRLARLVLSPPRVEPELHIYLQNHDLNLVVRICFKY